MDKIIINGLKASGIIGIYDNERVTPQEMVISVEVSTDISRAASTDNIAYCVDYEKMASKIKMHAQTAKRFTVEALVEDLAKICLNTPGVARVKIRLEKTQAIDYTQSVGVEIERENPSN